MTGTDEHDDGRSHELEWRRLALLGVPSLVLALATTAVTTYLPVRLEADRASTTMIGLLIATEGLMALVVPLAVGAWSDRLVTRLGGRLPFVLASIPPLTLSLVLMGFVAEVWVAALLLLVFFGAYFTGYEPYRALYPDVLHREVAGRAQSSQAIARGLGTFVALVGGGLLIAVADPAPFVAAAVLTAAGLATFVVAAARRVPRYPAPATVQGFREDAHLLWAQLRGRRDLQLYLVANALWELSLGALKTFVVLYLTIGLGHSVATSSLIIGGVALLLLAASPVSGALGDRLGRLRVMQWALPVYGLALLVPLLVTAEVVVALSVPFIAIGGGIVMTLPYAVLISLMSDSDHGALTGLYGFSRGLGTALGPLLAGAAIALAEGAFEATQGYQATWGVCAGAVLLSLVPLHRLRATLDAAPPG